jgi:hypothetical protein
MKASKDQLERLDLQDLPDLKEFRDQLGLRVKMGAKSYYSLTLQTLLLNGNIVVKKIGNSYFI